MILPRSSIQVNDRWQCTQINIVKKGVALPVGWALAGYWGVSALISSRVAWWGWDWWLCTH